MGQINRNHSGRTVLCGKGGGKLDESLGEHEVNLEFGTEGISAPGHSVDTSSTLLAQGVVDRYDHGHIGWKHPLDLFTDDRETLLWFDPAFRIHPVVCAPILVLASGRSDDSSDSTPAQTQKGAQDVLSEAIEAGRCGAGFGTRSNDTFQGF